MTGEDPEGPPRFTPYQRRLFAFLSVATFFEGYDLIAITQLLPNIRAELGIDAAQAGVLVAGVNLGAVAAWLLVWRADRWGRRRLLAITIAGYTIFTVLSGLAVDAWSYGLAQFAARTFLLAEWAVAMVVAAEEFPKQRRGFVIGTIQAFSTLGSVICAGLTPLLLTTSYGWRSVYFVALVPLLLLAWLRRDGLRETARFAREGPEARTRPFRAIWSTPYRSRLLVLALVWMLVYACSQNAITFWKEFVVGERGWSDADVGQAVTVAALIALPAVFFVGKLIDGIGRKRGAVLIFSLASFGVWGCYSFHERWALTGALALGVFGATAVLPVLSAYNTELFPTSLRGDAYAWANHLIGRIGHVGTPLVLGVAAASVGWGAAVRTTAIFPLLALVLIVVFLPETAGRDLDETAELGTSSA